MFSWKRQRKEEDSSGAATALNSSNSSRGVGASSKSSSGGGSGGDLAVECAPLGSSPDAVVSMAAGLLSTSSGASSLCSGLGGSSEAESGSIELAARLGQQLVALQAAPSQHQLAPGTPSSSSSRTSSVRAKAAYFEALIRCNTTAHIQCSAADGGSAHCATYSDGPCAAGCLGGGGSDGETEVRGYAIASGSTQQGSALAGSSGGAVQGEGEDGCAEEFSEVHMVLRMPRPRAVAPPPGGGKYGSIEEMEGLIEQLQGALEVSERQRQATVEAYNRRTSERENLMRVVRELTESRSKAVQQRASLAERYADLQQEYHRMLRIADLSRTVSKENMAKTSRTRSELQRVQLELHATKNHSQSLNEKNKKARVENAMLKEKVTLLERLDFEEVQESECKKHFTRFRLVETY